MKFNVTIEKDDLGRLTELLVKVTKIMDSSNAIEADYKEFCFRVLEAILDAEEQPEKSA